MRYKCRLIEDNMKLVVICNCPKCDTPIEVPVKRLGQLTAAMRKTPNTKEFMRDIAIKRWSKRNTLPKQAKKVINKLNK